MRVRKLIVNTFIREIVLFEDRIVITYNFKNNTDTGRHTPETVEKMLNEVDSAYTTEIGSSISLSSEPKQKDTNPVSFLFCPLRLSPVGLQANLLVPALQPLHAT